MARLVFPRLHSADLSRRISAQRRAPGLAMAAVVTGGLWNCFGDWYFCFPLDMGMAGAAIATRSRGAESAGADHGDAFSAPRKMSSASRLAAEYFARYAAHRHARLWRGVLDLGNVFIASLSTTRSCAMVQAIISLCTASSARSRCSFRRFLPALGKRHSRSFP